ANTQAGPGNRRRTRIGDPIDAALGPAVTIAPRRSISRTACGWTEGAVSMSVPRVTNHLAVGAMMLLGVAPAAPAQQAPWARADIPISGRDRVYAANQTSNTVSVIDPSSNKLLGVIRLGEAVPAALSPLYAGQLLVHGL